jgi:hypothetical protein
MREPVVEREPVLERDPRSIDGFRWTRALPPVSFERGAARREPRVPPLPVSPPSSICRVRPLPLP